MRFSLNQWTTRTWRLPDLAIGCAAEGVTGVGLWREPVADHGLARTGKLMRDHGLAVTSLCRGGFFQERDALADNRRAIEEAAALGAPVLCLVAGGLPDGSRDLDGARSRVAELIAELAPYAGEHGVRLAIEPLHPMYCSDRCVVSTLRQALDIAAPHPPSQVGVVVDTYHLWWDPDVWEGIARAGVTGRLALFQVADWVTPLPEGVLTGRGMLGDGRIDLRRFRAAVDAAGYTGPIEVEIFNEELWAMPGPSALELTLSRFAQHVL
ncbi:sugar phosphate isomerase/epimerase family protein [Actinomadura livida]|uniref:Sugar phosphate isomerase/epimerase n=1 Tax=Actinomadura livida TaxID=79909 RepID=A0A7W7II55_9ACTN|nr:MULTISPECIES: sugar phosphate isomerase/epimerase family protein [Actinomadura]MBB4777464.1 sugar phosphate isomerase/epimerase [Actinomadura catellatispora]GGU31342.1 xylose isomerase [Actinomadura livida]